MWASRGESFLSHLEMTREYLRVHSRFPSALVMPLYLMSEPVPLDMPVAVLGLNGVSLRCLHSSHSGRFSLLSMFSSVALVDRQDKTFFDKNELPPTVAYSTRPAVTAMMT